MAKARFFRTLGFDRARWRELGTALVAHAADGKAEALPVGPFGQKFVVRGMLTGSRRSASVVSVWMLTTPAAAPRFVTAYPDGDR